jgi:hypothetical protein
MDSLAWAGAVKPRKMDENIMSVNMDLKFAFWFPVVMGISLFCFFGASGLEHRTWRLVFGGLAIMAAGFTALDP